MFCTSDKTSKEKKVLLGTAPPTPIHNGEGEEMGDRGPSITKLIHIKDL